MLSVGKVAMDCLCSAVALAEFIFFRRHFLTFRCLSPAPFLAEPDLFACFSVSECGTAAIIRANCLKRSNGLAHGSSPGTPCIARGRIVDPILGGELALEI